MSDSAGRSDRCRWPSGDRIHIGILLASSNPRYPLGRRPKNQPPVASFSSRLATSVDSASARNSPVLCIDVIGLSVAFSVGSRSSSSRRRAPHRLVCRRGRCIRRWGCPPLEDVLLIANFLRRTHVSMTQASTPPSSLLSSYSILKLGGILFWHDRPVGIAYTRGAVHEDRQKMCGEQNTLSPAGR
jgi:hypothetical protein